MIAEVGDSARQGQVIPGLVALEHLDAPQFVLRFWRCLDEHELARFRQDQDQIAGEQNLDYACNGYSALLWRLLELASTHARMPSSSP